MTTHKRKRSPSVTSNTGPSLPAHLPSDSINPFSRSPGQLLQFSLAGLGETDDDPSLRIPNFPHRGVGYGLGSRSEEPGLEEEESENERGPERKERPPHHEDRQLGVLLQSIYQFLDRGDIGKASRAYGLVLQLQPHGMPIDVRHYNLWAIGAEILMRDGETTIEESGSADADSTGRHAHKIPARWGYAANMGKVRAYFETLIQQYPYDHRRTQKLSALDFWLAMFSCEIYNAHAEHTIRLSRMEEDTLDWDDEPLLDDEEDVQEWRQRTLDELKDDARKRALSSMSDISSRMDNLIRDQPFSKSPGFLKLRATVSLYLADLVVPIVSASPFSTQQGKGRRQLEHDRARATLRKVLEFGGKLDRRAMIFLGLVKDEDDDLPALPMYSSLPIR